MTLQERLRVEARASERLSHGDDIAVETMREAATRIDALEAALRDLLDGRAGCRDRARAVLTPPVKEGK